MWPYIYKFQWNYVPHFACIKKNLSSDIHDSGVCQKLKHDDSNTWILQLWLNTREMLAICAVFLFVYITLHKCATIITRTSTSMLNTNEMNS
jgi:hypothetical protein